MDNKSPGKKPYFAKLLIGLAVLILIGLGGWYAYSQKHQSAEKTDSIWAHYTSQKYGFEFDYLKGWGEPNVSVIKRGEGKQYNVLFERATLDLSHMTKISIDTNNAAIKTCPAENNCQTTSGVTLSYIKKQIKDPGLTLVAKGQDRYAVLYKNSGSDMANLELYRGMDLKKLNASAAAGYYSKKVDKSCPTDDVDNTNPKCINRDDLYNLNKSLASVKTL